jgi:hypothetical protein
LAVRDGDGDAMRVPTGDINVAIVRSAMLEKRTRSPDGRAIDPPRSETRAPPRSTPSQRLLGVLSHSTAATMMVTWPSHPHHERVR